MCSSSEKMMSEAQESFSSPKKKKPTATLANTLEKFLWQEIYNEYLRYSEATKAPPNKIINLTEYDDKYAKEVPPEDALAKKANIHRYPLYCTTAITLWNKEGDINKSFRRRYIVTRPLDQQTEKFGF